MKKSVIAVRMPNWIGDAVMATPVIDYVKLIFPDSYLIVITKQWTAPIFKNHPLIDELFLLSNHISKKPFLFFSSASALRKKQIDYYITLPDSLGTALFGRLTGAEERIGYKKEGRSFLLTKRYSIPSHIHRTDKYLGLFRKIKDIKTDLKTKIFPNQALTPNLQKIIEKHKLKDGFIGINPNSMASSRKWLPERFAELIKRLNLSSDPVILFGSAKEADYVREINQMSGNKAVNLAGKLTLSEYIQILQYCKIFITNDSGPMHIAFALQIPVLALEGPADIQETGNYNKKNQTVYIDKHVPCSPCVLNQCPNKGEAYKQCMKAITVDDVMTAVQKIQK